MVKRLSLVFCILIIVSGCFGPSSKQVQEIAQRQELQIAQDMDVKDMVGNVLQNTIALQLSASSAASSSVQITQPSIFQSIAPLAGLLMIFGAFYLWLRSKKKGRDENYA